LKTYGGPGDQGGPSRPFATTTSTGEIIAIAKQSLSDSLYWVKTDSIGQIISEKYLTGISSDFQPKRIAALSDGTSVIVGDDSPAAMILLKISPSGEVIWSKYYNSNLVLTSVEVNFDETGNIIVIGTRNFTSISPRPFLLKTDPDGNEIGWSEFLQNANSAYGTGFVETTDLGYAITGYRSAAAFLIKSNQNGETLWEKYYSSPIAGFYPYSITSSSSQGYIIGGKKQDTFESPWVLKADSNGDEIWQKTFDDLSDNQILDIQAVSEGKYYLLADDDNPANGFYLICIDEDGNKLWQRTVGYFQSLIASNIFSGVQKKIIVCGSTKPQFKDWDVFLLCSDSLGNIFTSAIRGNVHIDPEADCLPNPTEPALANWLVQATGNLSFATLTDSAGHFTLPVDTGSYQVTVTPPGPYWDVCNSPASVTIAAFYDTLALDFPVQVDEECPYLEVDISAPFLRRCFDNTYAVHYCNYGTVTAEDAHVEVTLDPYLTYQSSTIPFSTQNGNTLTFDLGDVAVNECGGFQITAYLDCDSTVLGQTHCTEAHIFPDSLCIPTNAAWDGSSIEVDVECAGDSVVFIITNTGTGNMAQPLDYIIIEDQIVLLQGDFQLNSGQSTTVTVPANGATFHLEAQQSPEHPSGTASVGATIEGCGGWMSIGFFIQWPTGNPNPFVDVDCQPNIGSFDPNDKTAFPEGFTEQHLIEPGTDIDYLLRFQNTGTDTAFKVVVVDVLPPELDLATVRPGASSHPYTYSVTPEGWLVFTFENILLPDSTTNEPGSHGFVRFRVSQRPGLGWGNVIANSALIYFDFNAPIQTNTTIHRIGQVFPWTLVGTPPPVFSPKNQIRILPNPLTDSALLQVDGIEPGNLRLVLTNTTGQVLREERTFGLGFEFRRGELASGVYFFKIEKDRKWIGSGKLMVK
jgi:uncharacterized repeat protein (TIGR01451 family)